MSELRDTDFETGGDVTALFTLDRKTVIRIERFTGANVERDPAGAGDDTDATVTQSIKALQDSRRIHTVPE